jgi:hypothetical protein
MSREIRDASLKTINALPAAGAANAHDSIDLGQVAAFPVNESLEVLVTVPALPALANTKKATLALEDSANDADFLPIPELATIEVTGAAPDGGPATTRRVSLPGTCRRYLRLAQEIEAAGGDNTAVSVTVELLF